MSRRLGFLACLLIASVPAPVRAGALFMGLGDLEGGSFSSLAYDVSGDGEVVVGLGYSASGEQAMRWTAETGMQALGRLTGRPSPSRAFAASEDGSVVVGYAHYEIPNQSGREAFRWEAGGMLGLGDLFGSTRVSEANGVSADGQVVVGRGQSISGTEAFRWQNGFMWPLGDFEGGYFQSIATGISADGSVIVGFGSHPGRFEAARWQNGLMSGLGDLPGGNSHSVAAAVSADGSVIVGQSQSILGDEAFRWEDGVMSGLGTLPGATRAGGHAYDVSADGSVVVGRADYSGRDVAFLWTEPTGMRRLSEVLVGDLELDLTGWTLRCAYGVSDDGRTIVGDGVNPLGRSEGWLAYLPARCEDGEDNDGDGLVDFPEDPACQSADGDSESPRNDVVIDVQPFREHNTIGVPSRLPLAVAILGSERIDVEQIDVSTLALGPGQASPIFDLSDPWVCLFSVQDVNMDGHPDLSASFDVEEADLRVGDTRVCLQGRIDDQEFESCDEVSVFPWSCGLGCELPVGLGLLWWLRRRSRQGRGRRRTLGPS